MSRALAQITLEPAVLKSAKCSKHPLVDQSNCVCSTLMHLFTAPQRSRREASQSHWFLSGATKICYYVLNLRSAQIPLGKCRHCTWKWFSSIWEQQGLSPALSLFFWREGKVASYVTKHHFTAVGRVMYEDRNGQCWNSRPHTRTQTHTQTQDWWMTRVLGPELRLVAWWLIKDFKRWRGDDLQLQQLVLNGSSLCFYEKTHSGDSFSF